MAQVFFDRVQETTSSSGLSDFTLAGAVSGYQAFSDVCSNGDMVSYCAVSGTAWEVGLGTYNSGVLERTTVQDSSTGSKINFSSSPTVFLTWSADDAASAFAGGSGTVTSVGLSLPGIFSVTGSPVTVSGTLTGSRLSIELQDSTEKTRKLLYG